MAQRRAMAAMSSAAKLLIHHPEEELAAAAKIAIDRKSPRLATIKMLLRQERTDCLGTQGQWRRLSGHHGHHARTRRP